MSTNTSTRKAVQTTLIKDFQEISELDNDQYLLGIKDYENGSGGKVKFETLIDGLISEDNDNALIKGTDDKLYIDTSSLSPSQIGDLSELTTANKTTLVAAINEVDSNEKSEANARANADSGLQNQIGTLTNLTTTSKTNLVSAVNEIDGDIGNLTSLTTSVKSSVVGAINSEVSARGTAETNIQNDYNGKIGSLSDLTTVSKTSIVNAINELDGDVGNLSNLTTTSKTNLVSAVNEVKGEIVSVDNKADKNLANVNNAGKVFISSMAMPSSNYIELTLSVSGGKYVAPADGYIQVVKKSLGSGEYLNTAVHKFYTGVDASDAMPTLWSSAGGQVLSVFFPVAKNDEIYIYYSLLGATVTYKFIYAKGSESEAG